MGRHREGPFKVYPREDSDILWVRFWVTGERKPRREPTGERDRERADERAAEMWQEAQARAGHPVQPDAGGPVPLSRYAARLLEEVKTLGRAPSYHRDLEGDLRLHILPRWSTAAAVTSADWLEQRVQIHAEGQSWASVKRIAKHLRQLLRFCLRKGAISSVPEIQSPEQELIDREAAEFEALSREERDAFFVWLVKKGLRRSKRIYEVMFFSAFRKSTIQRIAPAWLNLKERTIRVPASSAKNSRTRVYWLHARTLRALKEQMAENAAAARGKVDLAAPIFGRFDCSTVFWTAMRALGLVSVEPAVYAVEDVAGVRRRRLVAPERIVDKRGLTPHHVTRRTAATMLVEAGVSTKDRMAAGGWESIDAAERYDLPREQLERSKRALRRLR